MIVLLMKICFTALVFTLLGCVAGLINVSTIANKALDNFLWIFTYSFLGITALSFVTIILIKIWA